MCTPICQNLDELTSFWDRGTFLLWFLKYFYQKKINQNQSDNKNFKQCAESESQEFPNYEEHIPVTYEKKKGLWFSNLIIQ